MWDLTTRSTSHLTFFLYKKKKKHFKNEWDLYTQLELSQH